MDVMGWHVPTWVLDWSGSIFVVISLWYLFEKRLAYWHWSNASLVPYFLLFLTTEQFMLAGLQASYLIFGIHGLVLWSLEKKRDGNGRAFNERFWFQVGWVLSLAIFVFTVLVTEFVDAWATLQFAIVSLSLVANWATTRKWCWSWPVWLVVNTLQGVYFWHWTLWGQFALQFALFAMSVWGWIVWSRDRRSTQPMEVDGALV